LSRTGRSTPGAEPSGRSESGLRAKLRQAAGVCVLTGGQTGVDTVAARAALRVGLPVHVVFPRGIRQEDGALTTARRRILGGAALHELTSPDFDYRTWTCVYLADAVILIDPAGGAGCQETVRAARSLARPILMLDSGGEAANHTDIAAWLKLTGARVLMVAGCRGSLLASGGLEQRAADGAAVAVEAARQRHEQLLGRSGAWSP